MIDWQTFALLITAGRTRIVWTCDPALRTDNFVAARRRLQQTMPQVPVFGLFAARKLLETDEYDDPSKF